MAKTRQKPAATTDPYSMQDALDFLMTIPELKEAFTRADMELALDDRGWQVPGKQWTSQDLDAQGRTTLVAKSRLYWQRDPLAKQAVRLWTDYALGTGITYKCEDDTIQASCDKFMKDRRNLRLTSSEGQRKLSKKCLIDGELFLALYDDGTMRTIDCLQITDIITDPDDDDHILGYRRLTKGNKVLVYKDWAATDEDNALLAQQPDPQTKGNIQGLIQDGVVIRHVPFDALKHRGNGLLFAAVDWSKENRRFMEARVAITQALAKFAWKSTVKGGQNIINQLVQGQQSSYATAGPTVIERKPVPSPASTWAQNGAIDMTPMPRATGAGDAKQDGDQIKLMVCAATGIMLHYYGDPSTGNLATATAMELPMLKQFASYQQFWMDVWRDVFTVVLKEEPEDDQEQIDIDLPPILAEDLQKLGAFLVQFTTAFPEAKVDEILQMCLVSMGVNNIPEVMEAIAQKRIEIDAQNKADQAHELAKAKVAGPQPAAPIAKAKAPVSEAMVERLIEALEAIGPEKKSEPIKEAAPMNLNITVENKGGGKRTKKGTAVRGKDGALTFTLEEENGA